MASSKGYVLTNATGSSLTNIPYGYIWSDQTQSIANVTLAQVATFNNNGVLNKITHSTSVDNSRIYVDEDGIYSICLHGQLDLASGTNKIMDIWWKKNGSDISFSNNSSLVQNANDLRLIEKTELLSLVAGDYLEVGLSGDSTNCRLLAVAAGTGPTRPAIPSIEITIFRVSAT